MPTTSAKSLKASMVEVRDVLAKENRINSLTRVADKLSDELRIVYLLMFWRRLWGRYKADLKRTKRDISLAEWVDGKLLQETFDLHFSLEQRIAWVVWFTKRISNKAVHQEDAAYPTWFFEAMIDVLEARQPRSVSSHKIVLFPVTIDKGRYIGWVSMRFWAAPWPELEKLDS